MKNNKGFSIIELIIVIVIIAVLGSVFTPLLVKYISKARLSTDIDTAGKISSAMERALSNEKVRDNAVIHVGDPHPVNDIDGGEFRNEVFNILNVDAIKGKIRKDVDGNLLENGTPAFYYTLDTSKNKIVIYYGGKTEDYQIYPITGKKLLDY
ncbi:MAG: prepilin-type N-terminal cleavage/methylation domain-containing protein [Lachnospiraceae bacterium]|nr:prepilin-type N-terminal cleavage/methylation domain-containing protein [Lachnospiraceae bacterium]